MFVCSNHTGGTLSRSGEIGRHKGLKIPRAEMSVPVQVRLAVQDRCRNGEMVDASDLSSDGM